MDRSPVVNAGAVEEIAGLLTRRTISTDVSQIFPFPEFKYQFPHEMNIVSGFSRVNEDRSMKLHCLGNEHICMCILNVLLGQTCYLHDREV